MSVHPAYKLPNYENSGAYERFVILFPRRLEKALYSFDNLLIEACQSYDNGLTWFWNQIVVRSIMSIEVGIPIPFILFIFGLDALAIQALYFMLVACVLSQIWKRFLFRPRPHIVGRAKPIGNEKTSSFPSRAVTCGTVFSYMICLFFRFAFYQSSSTFRITYWIWMPYVVYLGALIASFARIYSGVHYPSDCIAGFIQGIFSILVGTGIYQLQLLVCPSCYAKACYSEIDVINLGNLIDRVNIYLFVGLVIGFVLIGGFCIIEPIDFYEKFYHLFGVLLPCLLFQLIFLCKSLSSDKDAALPPPILPPSVDKYFISLGFIVIFAVSGLQSPKFKIATMLSYLFLSMVTFLILFITRVLFAPKDNFRS